MQSLVFYIILTAMLLWFMTLLAPWQPWRTRERLEADHEDTAGSFDLSDVTVVIPARNEVQVIEATLNALKKQGAGLKVILVDDNSDDGTAEKASQLSLDSLTIIEGTALPSGWTGKVWAQEQGFEHVRTPLTLLLDADIAVAPGLLRSLKRKMVSEQLHFVSLMAQLRFDSFWEKLLMPAFIYFFKLIYPFSLSNKPTSKIAAAAGGCILVQTEALRKIGGMDSIKNAVIDDCSLARKIKTAGYKTWIGLTHSVVSQRSYITLTEIWEMVARTAYSQLGYSIVLLMLCTLLMVAMFWFPVFGIMMLPLMPGQMSVLALLFMMITYFPVLKFYELSPIWALVLPLIAGLFLLMTWTSATRYWKGERSRWKGRIYHNL